ncbi:hypothetical protein GLOIN_2v1478982 [Rhizophagus irregularis DAOM 181602=DAOM 197198]|nr:hypothetical protein RhiirB3_170260 [Rhizophagus irregularis]GET66895.1 hypothetical protein GLOIN_2v1478982 [Rhizophagus irregularis DAOM 181602=DAOM 197198]
MQLCTALNKFAEHYRAAKLKSIPRLASFSMILDPTVNIRKLPASIKEKENSDPQVIPYQKKEEPVKRNIN